MAGSTFFPAKLGHHAGCGLPGPQGRRHPLHDGRDVMEEVLVACTKVVESRFALWGQREAILGAAAITGETDVTGLTVNW